MPVCWSLGRRRRKAIKAKTQRIDNGPLYYGDGNPGLRKACQLKQVCTTRPGCSQPNGWSSAARALGTGKKRTSANNWDGILPEWPSIPAKHSLTDLRCWGVALGPTKLGLHGGPPYHTGTHASCTMYNGVTSLAIRPRLPGNWKCILAAILVLRSMPFHPSSRAICSCAGASLTT